MIGDACFIWPTFVPLDSNSPKLFGFSEFLAGLALMVLAWTIADNRYRFRVRTAPIPLQPITFGVVTAVGFLALLTDLWRAEQWPVPAGPVLTPATWQATLGVLFLLTFLTWAWFAFIRPPVYGKWNSKRYGQALYREILKGSPIDMSIIADELLRSIKSIIKYASEREEPTWFSKREGENAAEPDTPAESTVNADHILLLISDKRFCRSIVESAPGIALAVFQDIEESKKYRVRVGIFAKNILNEAMKNKDSFLFNESEGYESGFMGFHKPISQAMYSNYKMVEAIDHMLEPDIWGREKWDAEQWEAYCRIVLIVFRDYSAKYFGQHSSVLYRAKGYIEFATFDLYQINGVENLDLNNDSIRRLEVVANFIKDAIKILDENQIYEHIKFRLGERHSLGTFYDHLADMVFNLVFSVANVTTPKSLCWSVQYVGLWDKLIWSTHHESRARKIVLFKVRRLIFDEIKRMEEFPNYKGAKILSVCLNVMGLATNLDSFTRDTFALHKAILSWLKRNYAWLHLHNHRVAEACLPIDITYDAKRLKLVRTYPAEGLRTKKVEMSFSVDMPSVEQKKALASGGHQP